MPSFRSLAIFASAVLTAALAFDHFMPSASAASAWPPAGIVGYWSGEGRLAFREGKFETVKCRVTYFADNGTDLKQNVRCATAGAKIDVKSAIHEIGGELSGTWEETVYNLKGGITGQSTDRGFRVQVRSDDLSANMDLLLKDRQQIIELQFFNSTLMGLTIVLTKGTPASASAPTASQPE